MLSTCTNGVLGVASLSTLPTYPIDGPRATSHTQGDDLLDTPRVVIISMQAKDFSIAGRTEMYLALKVHPPKNFCSRTFHNVPAEVFMVWVILVVMQGLSSPTHFVNTAFGKVWFVPTLPYPTMFLPYPEKTVCCWHLLEQ